MASCFIEFIGSGYDYDNGDDGGGDDDHDGDDNDDDIEGGDDFLSYEIELRMQFTECYFRELQGNPLHKVHRK